jgi:hypothetical protein
MHPRVRVLLSALGVLLLGGSVARTGGVQPPARAASNDAVPPFAELLRVEPKLRPELAGVHPRVFVTKSKLTTLRERAKTTHREEWRGSFGLFRRCRAPPPPPDRGAAVWFRAVA